MNWSATILPLVGVALGSASTVVGQYLTTRVAVRRDERERTAAERTERKDAILGFLSAAQSVELQLDRIAGGRPRDDTEAWDHLHALWLAKKVPELVCSAALAQAAHDYTLALHGLLRGEGPVEDSPAKRELRYAFMEAARRELGVEEAALRRGLPLATGPDSGAAGRR
jgi:hypothetical protein